MHSGPDDKESELIFAGSEGREHVGNGMQCTLDLQRGFSSDASVLTVQLESLGTSTTVSRFERSITLFIGIKIPNCINGERNFTMRKMQGKTRGLTKNHAIRLTYDDCTQPVPRSNTTLNKQLGGNTAEWSSKFGSLFTNASPSLELPKRATNPNQERGVVPRIATRDPSFDVHGANLVAVKYILVVQVKSVECFSTKERGSFCRRKYSKHS